MIKNILLIVLLTALAVMSGIFDVGTAKSLAAVILGSSLIGAGIVIAIEK